jgi:TetR/AcrR family transcriptional regulator, mexJK operon transcriptional repressor
MELVTGRAMKSTIGSRRTGAGSKPKRKTGNQAGRPTAAELEKRKLRVIQVATELFVGHGFAATSLVDIAREAGVATRTLYEHFGDKEAIFREVIFARDAEAMVDPPTLQSDDTLFSVLRRAGHYSYEVTYRDRSIGLMRLMIAESKRFPDFMKSVGTSIFARFRRDFEKLFQSMEAAELIPAGDHARSAELFADLMLGAHPIMTYTNWNAEPPTEADVDERVNLFILGRFGAVVAKRGETRKAKIKAA